MKDICITNVRLDLGAGRRGAAEGPKALHEAGLAAALEALGHRVVAQHEIGQDDAAAAGPDPRTRHLEAIASTCARLADSVELCLQAGCFPLLLGGDHSQAMGTVAGLVRHFRPLGKELGVLWVDAHADMNTPDTTPTGNLHGMPLAVLLGHGPGELTRLGGSSSALAPRHVVLFGVRDVDAAEEALVHSSGVRVFRRSEVSQRGVTVCLAEAMTVLSRASAGIHLSYDLDACDPTLTPGVTTPVPHGLDRDEALKICEVVARSGRLVSMELVELNPLLDTGTQTGQLAVRLIEAALTVRHGHRRAGPRPAYPPHRPRADAERRIGILAQSLFRETRAQGFATNDIVSLASALLGEVIAHVKEVGAPGPRAIAEEVALQAVVEKTGTDD